MKYNFICEGGCHDNYFDDRNNPPAECKDCFEKFDSNRVVELQDQDEKEVAGLTLIYQITQQCLEIPTSNKVVLGREGFGAELFSSIFFNGEKVVSRIHCSIEFRNGKFYLEDEGSKNGTFYGIHKMNCKESPQVIEDEGILYIGEEAFYSRIHYKQVAPTRLNSASTSEQIGAADVFRCSFCTHEFNEKTEYCPFCERFHTLERVSIV